MALGCPNKTKGTIAPTMARINLNTPNSSGLRHRATITEVPSPSTSAIAFWMTTEMTLLLKLINKFI
ncbi:uncharacterized protein DFE_2863 [Desulfovibrio ferrophilus]|uniref:Uncharacterized protein n=1 Tax=Desulfovibrio ferrophilus TaxID=241368 RepID=A0A2Z6B240_9BACT|nr:uncharacterized protein DFE_2863 [Desulfovibrio ferrophilus]